MIIRAVARMWRPIGASLLLVASTLAFEAAAETIRFELTHLSGGEPLGIGDRLSVDVYLDCDCAGGIADPSDFETVEIQIQFDEDDLTYREDLSAPNTAQGSPPDGLVVFETQQRELVMDGAQVDPYYGATGGPPAFSPAHWWDPATQDRWIPSRVVWGYTSLGFAPTRAGGEWYLATLVFEGAAAFDSTVIDVLLVSARLGNGTNLLDSDFNLPDPIVIQGAPQALPSLGTAGVALLSAALSALAILSRTRR